MAALRARLGTPFPVGAEDDAPGDGMCCLMPLNNAATREDGRRMGMVTFPSSPFWVLLATGAALPVALVRILSQAR